MVWVAETTSTMPEAVEVGADAEAAAGCEDQQATERESVVPYQTMSEGCVLEDDSCKLYEEAILAENSQYSERSSKKMSTKEAKISGSQCSGTKSRGSQPRSDASENNSCPCRTNVAIPCCRLRKCECPKECPPGTEQVILDPCCCNPCMPTPFVDNLKLKAENRELKRCIDRVRACAVTDACDMIKDVMTGCKCCCCKARKKLRPCKSTTTIPCRETWLCVPMPGSSRCGGYTPSGWNKLLKKCRDLTSDPCSPCEMAGQQVTACAPIKRCKCLPQPKACPPCPHLCTVRALPARLRPYTPCCPLYFPNSACSPTCYVPSTCGSPQTDPSATSYKSLQNCCKPSGITPPPYRPMYMNVSAACPQTSASVPATLSKVESIIRGDTAGVTVKSPIYSPKKIDTPPYVSQSR